MRLAWFITLRSSLLSLLVHAVVILLLFVSFSFSPQQIVRPNKNVNIVQATKVDQKQIDAELDRLKKQEKEKEKAEQKRLDDLKKQAEAEKNKVEAARKKRLDEEKKQIAARKKKELEQQKRDRAKKELAKLEQQQKELERQKQIEQEKAEAERIKKQKAEEERKKKEAEAKKKEEERIRKEKEAAEKKRREEEEKRLQAELAAEERKIQESLDRQLIADFTNAVYEKVSRSFNKVGLPENLECKLRVKLLPGGEVVDATVAKSSGNDIFDRRAVNAIQKASPLPVPDDIDTFERLNLRDITFTFTP